MLILKYIIIILIILLFFIDFLIKEKQKKISDKSTSKKIMSETERQIANYLERLGVRYKVQYTFKGCRDKGLLPFDFAIIDESGKVLMLIEYDGEQHSQPVNFNGEGRKNARKNFEKTKKHDKIKNNFCKRKGIKLIRIDYTERKDLYKIIKRELMQSGIIN